MGAILVIGGKPKGMDKGKGYDEPEKDDGDESDDAEHADTGKEARMEAAKAMIRAVKMGDAGALDKALEAHYEACEGMGGDEEE